LEIKLNALRNENNRLNSMMHDKNNEVEILKSKLLNLEKNSYIIPDLENKIRLLNDEIERKKRENLD
jgi:hypothetical protein